MGNKIELLSLLSAALRKLGRGSVARARVGRVYTHCRIMCTRVPCHHVSFQAREIDNLAENARSNRVFHRARVNSLVR